MGTTEESQGEGEGEEEWSIEERERRLDTIAEVLEEGDVSLAKAKALRDEADEHFEALQAELDRGEGELFDVTE